MAKYLPKRCIAALHKAGFKKIPNMELGIVGFERIFIDSLPATRLLAKRLLALGYDGVIWTTYAPNGKLRIRASVEMKVF